MEAWSNYSQRSHKLQPYTTEWLIMGDGHLREVVATVYVWDNCFPLGASAQRD